MTTHPLKLLLYAPSGPPLSYITPPLDEQALMNRVSLFTIVQLWAAAPAGHRAFNSAAVSNIITLRKVRIVLISLLFNRLCPVSLRGLSCKYTNFPLFKRSIYYKLYNNYLLPPSPTQVRLISDSTPTLLRPPSDLIRISFGHDTLQMLNLC